MAGWIKLIYHKICKTFKCLIEWCTEMPHFQFSHKVQIENSEILYFCNLHFLYLYLDKFASFSKFPMYLQFENMIEIKLKNGDINIFDEQHCNALLIHLKMETSTFWTTLQCVVNSTRTQGNIFTNIFNWDFH